MTVVKFTLFNVCVNICIGLKHIEEAAGERISGSIMIYESYTRVDKLCCTNTEGRSHDIRALLVNLDTSRK